MSESTRKYQRFFAELKRRHVFRVMAIYGAVGFVLLQVAELLGEGLRLPEFFLPLMTTIVLLGFPIAVVLAWAFEQTPEGFKRTEPAGPEEIEAIISQPASRRWPSGVLALIGMAALIVGAWWVGRQTAPGAGADPAVEGSNLIRSLAVLPLDNLTGDEDQAYFVDGMHDALISQLSRIQQLTVLSRTSTLRYRDTDKTMGEIAEELDVEALVEGSVFQAGDTVRITVQLVRGSPEEHLWSEDYVDQLSNAISLHGRVARSIAREIQLSLSPRDAARLAHEGDVDPAAQDAYLRGRALWRTRQRDNLERSVALMQEAVALEPDFALGYAGLADAHLMHATYGGVPGDSLRNAYGRAREAAVRALELNPELPEPYATLGWVEMVDALNWAEAEKRLRRSLKLNPSYAQGWAWLAYLLGAQGQASEAIAAMRRAVELDPFSPLMHRILGHQLYLARRCGAAMEHAERALELDPGQGFARSIIRDCHFLRGDDDEAFRAMLAGDIPPELADTLRSVYEASGWEGVSRFFNERGDGSPPVPILVRLDRHEEAVSSLRAAYERRSPFVVLIVKVDPTLDPLRDRADFQALLEDMGLAD